MPQMKPLNWLYLYILFTITLLMMNFLNYYLCYKFNNQLNLNIKNNKNFSWKW